jgi:hypothetical protein
MVCTSKSHVNLDAHLSSVHCHLQEKLYNYNSPSWSPAIGHFTQIVWKESKTVACAYACQVYVCQYQPAGNVIGYFDRNVGRRKW